ncbi:hypothetical protein EHR03_13035 [Leptospira mayottensis]|uniref:Uncharacterized protein n=1 Tax=Leptospira mayottensis 200901116 TaxID=1192864 RepID=M6V6G9_9LEPT|nr:hypothetical protein [Leptospira mayottensis]AVH81586.1 hypothetical protein [Leptospira mayottensis 200901116]TGN00349.1 hypothetical protein EHR03_13035 [Leptospira mayottensis]
MKPQLDVTLEQFLSAFDEGEKKVAEKPTVVPNMRVEDRGPFTGERFYRVESRKTGELCFASRCLEQTAEHAGCYQVTRYSDHKRRWVTTEEFTMQFRRLIGKPERVYVGNVLGVGHDYKRTAIEDDESGSLLNEVVEIMRKKQQSREVA